MHGHPPSPAGKLQRLAPKAVKTALRLAAPLTVLALACSGPQPLKVAIRGPDLQSYQAAVARYGPSPKQAFIAARAAETGRTAEEIAAQDERISTTRNPFKAARDPSAVSKGAVIYQAMCMRCHGENVGGNGPDMLPAHPTKDFHAFDKRFAVTLHGGAPRAWFNKISNGYGPTVESPSGPGQAMPPFKDALAREQIWLAITYLQSLDQHAEKR